MQLEQKKAELKQLLDQPLGKAGVKKKFLTPESVATANIVAKKVNTYGNKAKTDLKQRNKIKKKFQRM